MAEDGIADSGRAWRRLAAATALGTVGGVGMWSVVVVLSAVQAEFGVDRAAALPSTLTMLGFAVGGLATLLADALLQAAALALCPAFDDLTSVYVISALFGLFQGGIVPAYAINVREDLAAEEAGARIGAVLMATLAAMLKLRGLDVSGSDQDVYPPMSDQLEQAGIALTPGFDPSGVPEDVDLGDVGRGADWVGHASLRRTPCSKPGGNSRGADFGGRSDWHAEDPLVRGVVVGVGDSGWVTTCARAYRSSLGSFGTSRRVSSTRPRSRATYSVHRLVSAMSASSSVS